MADIVKLEKDGYGQLELNNVAFRRDGRIEAQCKLDETTFANIMAENGMLVAVDNIKRVVKPATATLASLLPIGIVYSSEHIYDERTPGLKNFALGVEDVLPRIGYLSIGDKFHTNTISYSDELLVDEDTDIDDPLDGIEGALKGGVAVYAGISSESDGYWEVTASAPSAGPVARVVEISTMPDGQIGLKLQVIKA